MVFKEGGGGDWIMGWGGGGGVGVGWQRGGVATDLWVKSVGGCDSAEMERPAIRSTAHSPILVGIMDLSVNSDYWEF